MFEDNHNNHKSCNTNSPFYPVYFNDKKSAYKHTHQHHYNSCNLGFHGHSFTSFKIKYLLTNILVTNYHT
ncbi:MAG: hypothetical protein IPP71_01450 [Bacteroidetes bacterium]|nr:hypothetical protein [Bacteroidota bacterium]